MNPGEKIRAANCRDLFANPKVVVLSIALAIAAALTIWGGQAGRDYVGVVYLCKPLATILILALAALASRARATRYILGVVAGLVCSLAGDVFLMLPRDAFLAGLASFLAAHVCYLVAFTSDSRLAAKRLPFLLWAVAGVMILAFLWPGIQPALRLPVILYVGCLLTMAAQAASRAQVLRTPTAIAAGLGATLFTASDTLLAIDRFRFAFAGSHALVMVTYFAAQWLIALSTADGQEPRATRAT